MERDKLIEMINTKTKCNCGVWHKLLPYVLFLSFVFACTYQAIQTTNYVASLGMANTTTLIYYMLLFGLVSFIGFKIIYWLYKSILQTSPFTFCIPYVVFDDQFKTLFVIKNVVIGFFGIVFLSAPYLFNILPIMNLVMSLIIIPVIYKLDQKYILDLIANQVFKTFAVPYFLYFVFDVVFAIMEVV